MDRFSVALVVSTLVFASVRPTASIVIECDRSNCPLEQCADPVYPSPGACCPTCEHSNCMFRGCVTFGLEPRWLPDPCTTCKCENGRENCTRIDCGPPPNCFGYPMITKQGECCPVCDFGIREDECAAVPVSRKTMFVSLGDTSCREEVTIHSCDKKFIMRDGIVMKCVPSEKLTSHKFTTDCPVKRVTYHDVKTCEAKRAGRHEILEDFDLNPRQCHLYINPHK